MSDPFKQLVADCRPAPLVYDGVRPDLCSALEQVILSRMQNDRGRRVGSLNKGGWKSGEDFFLWNDVAVQGLRSTISEMVESRALVAWAMVNRAGSEHPRHQHRVAILSGVYYVVPGDPLTPTVFETPCDGGPKQGAIEVEPYPGRLVLCRGETWHYVPKYVGESPRITIAFDVRR